MECTRLVRPRLVVTAVAVATVLGTAAAGPGPSPVRTAPTDPVVAPSDGSVTLVRASDVSGRGTFRASNRAW